MLIVLACCAASQPVRDHVEHTLATAARWDGPVVRELVWAIEPPEGAAACVNGVASARMTAYVCVDHGVTRINYESPGDIAVELHDALVHATSHGTQRTRCAYV